MKTKCFIFSILIGVCEILHPSQSALGQNSEIKGVRPYELDWANRKTDDHTPLVDFDLLKLHPFGCDLGFVHDKGRNDEEKWDCYLAGTIAYGHLGRFADFSDGLVGLPTRNSYDKSSGMMRLPLKSYYLIQQLQSSYCKALVKEIRYADENDKLMDVSAAISTDVYRRLQVCVKYDNGLVVWVNGNKENNWKIQDVVLPPNDYYACDPEGKLIVFSALINGSRDDYVHSPAYDYVDGRGKWVKTPWAASDGQLIILKNPETHSVEVIPFETKRFAIALDKAPASITALDIESKELRSTTGSFHDGMYYLNVVSGAISYLLKL